MVFFTTQETQPAQRPCCTKRGREVRNSEIFDRALRKRQNLGARGGRDDLGKIAGCIKKAYE